MTQLLKSPKSTDGADAGRNAAAVRSVRRRRSSVFPYVLIAPLVVALLVFTYFPVLSGVRLSFTNAAFGAEVVDFVGLQNYRDVFTDPRFWQILYQTVVWTVFSVAGSIVLGVAAALALQRQGRLQGLLRAVMLLPWVAPPLVIAYVWRYLLSRTGPISPYLATAGLTDTPPDVLNSTGSVLGISVPLIALILLGMFAGFPLVYVFALGALSAVPPELYDAAKVDGASPTRVFRWIVWPLIIPVIETVTVLLTLIRFGGLDLPFLLTRGGPGDASSILGLLIYNTSFASLRADLAAAMSVAMLIAVLPLCVVYVRRTIRSDNA